MTDDLKARLISWVIFLGFLGTFVAALYLLYLGARKDQEEAERQGQKEFETKCRADQRCRQEILRVERP
jgi:hypothetical protein